MKKWALVENPGTENQYVVGTYNTFADALKAQHKFCHADIMRIDEDGSLTTEF